jgi:hypothetical protein
MRSAFASFANFCLKSAFAPWRPPASPPETLRVTMWAGLRGTLCVAKWLELREALRAGLSVRFFNSKVLISAARSSYH